MFMLRIRFDTFCTVPVIASSAPMRRANWISQPSQACRLLACASRAIGVISMSEKRPESLSSCRNRSLRRASRSCSSGRAPLIAPSRLVSINSKSKTATDCATGSRGSSLLRARQTPPQNQHVTASGPSALRSDASVSVPGSCPKDFPPSMRRLLDGDEALPLQAFEYGERRRQQITALAVVPTPACDRRLDGDDQELGCHPFVTRFHCHSSLSRRLPIQSPLQPASWSTALVQKRKLRVVNQ